MSKYRTITGLIAGFANVIFASFLIGRMSTGHYANLWEINAVTALTFLCLWSVSGKK
jgi:hypothetical protein